MTYRQFGLTMAALMMGACTMQPTSGTETASNVEPSAPPAAVAGKCNADAVQSLVGQTITDAVVEEAKRSSGASVVRRILPGQAVTMDYREDRLNIEVDESGKVARVRCG